MCGRKGEGRTSSMASDVYIAKGMCKSLFARSPGPENVCVECTFSLGG